MIFFEYDDDCVIVVNTVVKNKDKEKIVSILIVFRKHMIIMYSMTKYLWSTIVMTKKIMIVVGKNMKITSCATEKICNVEYMCNPSSYDILINKYNISLCLHVLA